MNFSAFGSFPAIHHQFSTAVTSSSSVPSSQVWNHLISLLVNSTNHLKTFSGEPLHNLSDFSSDVYRSGEIPRRRHGGDTKQICDTLSIFIINTSSILQYAKQSTATWESKNQLRSSIIGRAFNHHFLRIVARHHKFVIERTRRVRLNEKSFTILISRRLSKSFANISFTPSLP